jgi:hypothetical protein
MLHLKKSKSSMPQLKFEDILDFVRNLIDNKYIVFSILSKIAFTLLRLGFVIVRE